MDIHKEVDATNLNCPLPILRCKKALNEIAGNEVLKITATDPGATRDFEAFCKQTGHALINLLEENGTFTFFIRKRA